ncbi:hypothetical protein EXIGLDRAFT_843812 [Exidia glandulosa HHB12029]|uniref:Uncharacterized protein n=1 Tax=Exidia glandulosa HHB12029 TaxID=1314781 RepID=A0A165CF73_EXIGL|nr:hypothetical protein EXIGLDRAFT_843812 [Exidia glandulosa HHB12029]
MSAVSSPLSSSSRMSPAVSGTSIALKIARDATANVPIVGQILGVAVHIADLAKQAQKNKEAMRALARKASILAQRVDEVVSGRTPSANLLERLVNLKGAFTKVEDFMADEVEKRNPAKNLFRSLFVLPAKLEDLSQELDSEVASFSLAAAIDMRLYIEESALYDGQLRRLRDCDIRMLDVIMERETERSIVTYAKARVDGVSDLMVVKYTRPRTDNGGDGEWYDTTGEDVLEMTSAFDISHPNLSQLYGRAVENGAIRFSVLRSGVYPISQYLLNRWDDPIKRLAASRRIHQYVMAASAHLERLALGWHPASYDSIVVDDRGEPSIGAFDDILPIEGGIQGRAHAQRVTTSMNNLVRAIFPPPQIEDTVLGRVDSCDEGRLKMWTAAVKKRPRVFDNIWARLRNEDLVIDRVKWEFPAFLDCGYISPAVVLQAARHWEDLDAREQPLITLPRAEEDRPDDSTREFTNNTITPPIGFNGQDVLDGTVQYRIIRRATSRVGSRPRVEFGLHFHVKYDTEDADMTEDYFLHLSEAIATDIFSILDVPREPIGGFDPEYSFKIFDGALAN